MSEQTRDEMRQLQDRFLDLAPVRKFAAEQGEDKSLWYLGPTIREVRNYVYPKYAYAFRDAIDEYGA